MSAVETIASSPLILDNIFMSMDLFGLYKARRVCKSWKSVADAEIKKRQITSKVDCVTVGYPVDKKRSDVDSLKIFKGKFDAWKRSWESPPTVLLISPSFTFEFEMENNWVPNDCTCVVIEGGPVCVDGVHTETEGDDQDEFECCNLVAFHSLSKASVLASKSSDDSKEFFKVLHDALVDPTLKFLIIFVHREELNPLLQKADKAVYEAARRGVVILCYSSYGYSRPMVANFHGHKKLTSGLVALCFKGEDISATSRSGDACAGDGIKELVDNWKKIDRARRRFAQSCLEHEMSNVGFCANCKSQTLGFLMAPPHSSHDGYEEYDDDPRPPCFNQEQDAFRFIIPNVPLIGWLGDQFVAGSNVNVDAETVKTEVLDPVVYVNYIFALLVLR